MGAARRFPAAEKALCATLGGALAHARFASLCFGGSPPCAALSLTPGSPLGGGALAHARFASLCFGGSPPCAALSLTLGSPPCAALSLRSARRRGAPLSLTLGSPLRCGALAPPGSPPSVSARRFQAAEKALCATFWRRSRSRSVRRFVAALSLALGSPPCGASRPFCPCSKPCSKKRPCFFEHGQSL